MGAIAVIYAVRPKPGCREAVRILFERHTPALRRAGSITDRRTILLWSPADEVFVESFEWKSAEHSRKAESTEEIQGIWGDFARLADFVPLASLNETKNVFSHFEPL